MTLHVVSLPHTQTTREYARCAYTTKVRRFCQMMAGDFDIVLYAGEENEAPCRELVPLATREWQSSLGFDGPDDYLAVDWDPVGPLFGHWNARLAAAIGERLHPGDLVLLITGTPHVPLRYALPSATFVEFGVGYEGVAFDHLVFESNAWRCAVDGWRHGANRADPDPRHVVIPNYFDPEDFPLVTEPGDYALYLGRLTARKGWRIAQAAAEEAGVRFVCAGQGDETFDGYGEYLGPVSGKEAAELLGHARVVLCPTRYLEPFCGVHIEAMLCGTPVATSDWGVFPETVTPYTGTRCRLGSDWPAAIAGLWDVDAERRRGIAASARRRYSLDAVRPRYLSYLSTIMEEDTMPSEDVKPEDTNEPAETETEEATQPEAPADEAEEESEEAAPPTE